MFFIDIFPNMMFCFHYWVFSFQHHDFAQKQEKKKQQKR